MSIYLLILALLYVKFWNIIPLGNISQDTQLVGILLYLVFGCFFFKRKKFVAPHKYKYLKWIFVGIFLSMLPAYLFYDQPFFQSIITYRVNILLLTIVALFKISPKIEEIVQALFYFAILMLLVEILIPLYPALFIISEKTLNYAYATGDMSSLKAVAGIGYVCIPMFYYLQKIKEKFSFNTFLRIIVLFAVFMLAENRSNLFPVILFTLYTFLHIRSKHKPIIICGLLLICAVFFISQKELFLGLYEESVTQINDTDYNRNKAYVYYLFNACPNFLCYILGNGRISIHHNPMVANLMDDGIYNTDVGFIGYWNEFGLIPVICMFVMFCKTLKTKSSPYFMKLLVLHFILGGLTVSYFGSDVKIFQFVVFYYLFYYFANNTIMKEKSFLTIYRNHKSHRKLRVNAE